MLAFQYIMRVAKKFPSMCKFNIFYHMQVLFVYNNEIMVGCFLQKKTKKIKIFQVGKILCCLWLLYPKRVQWQC